MSQGVTAAAWGAAIGGVTGAIGGGIRAHREGVDIWKGYPKHMAVANPARPAFPTVERDPVEIETLPREYRYRSPINANFGSQDGECALRCLEEFSNSWQETRALGLDCDYWWELNGSELGVNPGKVVPLVNSSDYFSARQIGASDIDGIANAISNDERIMVGLMANESGSKGHAVMLNELKTYSNGGYEVFFSETSPGRIAPFSETNLLNPKYGYSIYIISLKK